jgi:ribosomal protein L32
MTRKKMPALVECPGCGRVRRRAEYYQDRTRPSGLSRLCKDCHKARMRQYWRETYYPQNKETIIAKVMARMARRKERQQS